MAGWSRAARGGCDDAAERLDLAVLQVASVASGRELSYAEWSRLKAIRYELAEVSEKWTQGGQS